MKTNIGNKQVFAHNLRHYVDKSGRSQRELAETLAVAQSTFNDWATGKKYPRIDKIEALANIFGILKSDLIEDRSEMEKNNEALADLVIRLRNDSNFRAAVEALNDLDPGHLDGVRQMLQAFAK